MGTMLADDFSIVYSGARFEEEAQTLFLSDSQLAFAPERLVTSQMIICGNCAGHASLPRKTFLRRDGCCSTCGGRSYVLAAKLAPRLEGLWVEEQ